MNPLFYNLILAVDEVLPAGGDAAAGPPSPFIQLMPLVFMFGIFYLLVLRPQQTEKKKHRNWLQTIKKNDKIVTAGGIIGTVADVSNDDEITLKIDDTTRVKIMRASISSLYGKDAAEKS